MLNRLRSLKKPIHVGIIGAGSMGKGLLYQCSITPGIECIAISDKDIEKAFACIKDSRIRTKAVAVSAENMFEIIETTDVLIEASTSVLEGANYVITALEHSKVVVLMNAEIDLTFSLYFQKLASKFNTVCTSCDGDQYGVLKHLIDDLKFWDFQLVLAGNIKGFLNYEANPTSIVPEADKRGQNHRQCVAMTDGTKLNIEMSILANAFDLETDILGMHGPRAKHVKEALNLFDLDRFRHQGSGIVDYLLGAEPNGGVFAIGYHNNAYQRKMLYYYKMGPGPYYLFYHPYHLCHIEAMSTLASAFLDKKTFLYPKYFKTNVFSYAKKALKKGEILDGLGGYTVRGMIRNCLDLWRIQPLPILLSKGLRLKRDVPKDKLILLGDVDWDPQSPVFELYAKAQES